jgi:hypothetical protein
LAIARPLGMSIEGQLCVALLTPANRLVRRCIDV